MQAGPGVLSEGNFGIYHGKQLVAELDLSDNDGQLAIPCKQRLVLKNKVADQNLLVLEHFDNVDG